MTGRRVKETKELNNGVRHTRWMRTVVLMGLGMAGGYWGMSQHSSSAAQDLSKGKAIYEKLCLICHGPQGKGDGPTGKVLIPPATAADSATAVEPDCPWTSCHDVYRFWSVKEASAANLRLWLEREERTRLDQDESISDKGTHTEQDGQRFGARSRWKCQSALRADCSNQGGAAMTCNVGGVERPIRIALGVLLLAVGALADLPPVGAWIIAAVGIVALVTGAIGFCPAWKLFGINTCAPKPSTKP